MKKIMACFLIVSWLNLFALSWLIIVYEKFQNNTSAWFWIFFLVVAIAISTSISGSQENKNDRNTVE